MSAKRNKGTLGALGRKLLEAVGKKEHATRKEQDIEDVWLKRNQESRAGGGELSAPASGLESGVNIQDHAIEYTGKKSDRRDVFLGFDLGTSCSKVIIRDSSLSRAWAVPLLPSTSVGTYLLSTRLVLLSSGEFRLDGEGERFCDIKIGLMDDPNSCPSETNNVTYTEIGVAYLALAIRRARKWFLSAQRTLYADLSIDWWVNLGIPTRSYDDSPIKRAFAEVAHCGWWLSAQEGAVTLRGARETVRRARSAELDLGVVAQRINVYPEIAAEVAAYARSDARQNGLHLMIDVGASTLDVSSFILSANDTYAFLEVDIQRQGTYYLHRHRVGRAHCSMETKYDPFDVTSSLPETCRELVPTTAEAGAIDDDFLTTCVGTVTGVIVKTKGRRASLEDQFDRKSPKPLRTFLCGGGGQAALYGRLVKEVERSVKRNFYVGDLQVVPLPQPAALYTAGLAKADFHRLAVAYGLSFPHFDLGRVIPPSEIEDMERRPEKTDWPEPVTKDHV